jgi:hypothetical protein
LTYDLHDLADDGGIALINPNNAIPIDQVGLNVNSVYLEGHALPPFLSSTNLDQSYERVYNIPDNNCTDSSNNFVDFFLRSQSDPQNLSSTISTCGDNTALLTATASAANITGTAAFNQTGTAAFNQTGTAAFNQTGTAVFNQTGTAAFNQTGTAAFNRTGTAAFNQTGTAAQWTPTNIATTVFISEVAWSGTRASSSDEWIELYNPTLAAVSLDNWRLETPNGPRVIPLSGTIPPQGFYLIQRFSGTFQDVTADLTYDYFVPLSDSGETLQLKNPGRVVVDTANKAGGAWPGGSAGENHPSMERLAKGGSIVADSLYAWVTNSGAVKNGHDAMGNAIYGTPKQANWAFSITITPSPTRTITLTPTPTRTPTSTRTRTPTGTLRTPSPTPMPTLNVVISEIAWMGTSSSNSSDEWVELYNRSAAVVDLSGWSLRSTDGVINIEFASSDIYHTIAPGGYYLLAKEGTFDSVITNKTITDTFSNDGKFLVLRDDKEVLIDTANANGGAWPAGTTSPYYATMERHLVSFRDVSANWYTFAGPPTEKNRNGVSWIYGTPGYANWAFSVTATPSKTPTPTRTATRKGAVVVTPSTTLVINEFMPRAGFDWNQDGKVNVFDEFIEIANYGPLDINLNGWKLDDAAGQGSSPFTIPSKTLKVGEHIVFYASQTNILLSDGGDTVRLMNPNNIVKDAQTYSVIKVADVSWCRLPDINGSWFMDCFPTPNQRNSRTGEVPNAPPDTGLETPLCLLPDTLPEDFRNAECYGFGSNMWQAMYWDLAGWFKEFIVPQGSSKWDTFVE